MAKPALPLFSFGETRPELIRGSLSAYFPISVTSHVFCYRSMNIFYYGGVPDELCISDTAYLESEEFES